LLVDRSLYSSVYVVDRMVLLQQQNRAKKERKMFLSCSILRRLA